MGSHGELLTFGHGTASEQEIVDLLASAGVEHVVDVRIGPGSRRNPHVGRAQLERWLPSRGIAYRWDKRLGGFRPVPADSPDGGLRNRSFRGYAAHLRTDEFKAAIDDLLEDMAAARTTVMCSEAVWWRCHRRMIADYVQLVGHVPVLHLMHDGRLVEHEPTDVARVRSDGEIVYDGGAEPLL